MSKVKVKPHHIRDFWAYVRFNRRINGRFGDAQYFCPEPYYFKRREANTLRCFVEYESIGKMPDSPKEPRLLKLAMDGKKLVNFHIEQWSEGIAEGMFWPEEFEDHLALLPTWVRDGLEKQVDRLMRMRIGFTWTYIKQSFKEMADRLKK